MKRLIPICLAIAFISACGKKSDYLLVVDTSGSMQLGDTIGRVKTCMPRLLDLLKPGDSITLLEFDEIVRESPTVEIRDDHSKSEILEQVRNISANGNWTDMVEMIRVLKQNAARIKKQNRPLYIVVLSDGLDDPDPTSGRKRDRFDLNTLRSPAELPLKETFVYYISLGELRNQKLEQELQKLSTETETFEALPGPIRENLNQQSTAVTSGERSGSASTSGSPSDSVSRSAAASGSRPAPGSVAVSGSDNPPDKAMRSVTFAIRKQTWLFMLGALLPYLGIVSLGVLGLLGVMILVKHLTRGDPLRGTIVFYPEGGEHPGRNVHLDTIGARSLTIGARKGNRLRIKDLGIPGTLLFKGKTVGSNFCLKPIGKTASEIHFKSQRRAGLISPGDRFQIGEYSFLFSDDEI